MNIALASIFDNDLSIYNNIYFPKLCLKSNYQTAEKQLADMAIQLDEKIHFDNIHIDLILIIVQSESLISLDKLKKINMSYDDLFYLSNTIICKPNIFSMLSNLYKLDSNTQIKNKMIYLAHKLGIRVLHEI